MRTEKSEVFASKYVEEPILDGEVIPPDVILVLDCGTMPNGDSFVKICGPDGFYIGVDVAGE